jgi:hypothetical protein
MSYILGNVSWVFWQFTDFLIIMAPSFFQIIQMNMNILYDVV